MCVCVFVVLTSIFTLTCICLYIPGAAVGYTMAGRHHHMGMGGMGMGGVPMGADLPMGYHMGPQMGEPDVNVMGVDVI